LTNNVKYEMNVYFNTFPAEGKKILEQYGTAIQTEEETQKITKDTEPAWAGMKIEVPIPISS
jgi:hypothetical protein